MESKAKILGHPIHQQLIAFPLGLLGMAVIFDLINVFFDWSSIAQAAYYMIVAGIVTGLVAAVFGLIDWLAIPAGTRAKRVGLVHGAGNVIIVALFAIAWYLRMDRQNDPSSLAVILEVVGLLGALFTGWLGGELVDRLGVGVYPGANLDATNSLTAGPEPERGELARG